PWRGAGIGPWGPTRAATPFYTGQYGNPLRPVQGQFCTARYIFIVGRFPPPPADTTAGLHRGRVPRTAAAQLLKDADRRFVGERYGAPERRCDRSGLAAILVRDMPAWCRRGSVHP